MNIGWILGIVLWPLLVLAGLESGTVTRGGSGIKIGGTDRGSGSRGIGNVRGNSAVKIGAGRLHNTTRQRIFTTTTTTTTTPAAPLAKTYTPQSTSTNNDRITLLKVGMMVPYKSFGVRDYTRAVTRAVNTLQKSTRGPRLQLFQHYDIRVTIAMNELTPSPTTPRCLAILKVKLEEEKLKGKVAAFI